MEENRIHKRVLYMNLGTKLRGRPRNRWQDEVREDERIVGGEGWQEKVHNGVFFYIHGTVHHEISRWYI
jgi:hypothetical protein